MGILYNRFNDENNSWTLLTTFTTVNTAVPIGDLTNKTELLVVCNDIFSVLFCVRDIGTSTALFEEAIGEKMYSVDTGTGYRIDIAYRPYNPNYNSATLLILGRSQPSISGDMPLLNSVNTKVYVR